MSKGELALCVWSQTKNINKEKDKNCSLTMTFDVQTLEPMDGKNMVMICNYYCC